MKRLLVGCECSGRVRDEFARRGWDAWSCDYKPAEGQHIVGDCLDIAMSAYWDLGIFHPPCTFLSSSGLHWNLKRPGRARQTEDALQFVRRIMALPIGRIAVENPAGCIGTRIRPADQWINPYEFGDDASKRTGLWLKNLPLLRIDPRLRVPGRMVTMPNGKVVERWANQTDSGQNRLGPSETRAADRAVTYTGIAKAMADAWS